MGIVYHVCAEQRRWKQLLGPNLSWPESSHGRYQSWWKHTAAHVLSQNISPAFSLLLVFTCLTPKLWRVLALSLGKNDLEYSCCGCKAGCAENNSLTWVTQHIQHLVWSTQKWSLSRQGILKPKWECLCKLRWQSKEIWCIFGVGLMQMGTWKELWWLVSQRRAVMCA